MTSPHADHRHLRPVNTPSEPVHEPTPDDGSVNGARRVKLTPAAGIRLRPTFWLWDGRMPHGALTIGPGREGIGKSLFCSWLAARVTRGELPGVHYGQPKGVIYAATEDSWERTLAGRLVVAGADMQRVYRVEVEHITGHHVPLSLPVDCNALGAEIIRHDIGLLIVDPLISAVDGSLNTNQDADLRRALEPLAELADRTDCAVFGLAHFNKATGTDVLSRIMGGRAFSAVARAAIAFARDNTTDDGTAVISQVKNNLGRLDLPSLRYRVDSVELETEEGPAQWGQLVMLGETDVHVNDLLDEAPGGKDETKDAGEVAEWLRDYLAAAGGSAEVNEIFEQGKAAGGWSESQIRRAKKKLKIPKPHKDGMRGGWQWRLPAPEGDEGGEDDA
ncbi:AAA family ATPase [Amycolatopsis sp. GM8]|uniref:AAA family ATPase n=1 Tax=Amycolatopsis sp. GM8 TaxID=2896530 RepID=UPI001F1D121F|nr:AAA family ATPase [Amycolatopsis sp. GM8]